MQERGAIVINPPLRLLAAIHEHLGEDAQWMLEVPGRDMWIAAILNDRPEYAIIAPDLDAKTSFDGRSAKRKQTTRSRPLPRWARYPAGALVLLREKNLKLPPMHILIVGDEALGPRYEHALGMALLALYYHYNERPYDQQSLVSVMERVLRNYLDQ